MAKIDDTDRKILYQMRENSNISNKELAGRLGIHQNTLIQRLKKLEQNKVIERYNAVVNYEKVGIKMMALIFVKVKMDTNWEAKLKPMVESIPQIESLILVTGYNDTIAVVRVKDKDELAEVVRKIQENGVITKTITHLALDSYKLPKDYNPF